MGVIKDYQRLSKWKIENSAYQIILRMQSKKCIPEKWSKMADCTADFLDLGIVWESFDSIDNEIVAAKISPSERIIELNDDFRVVH